MRTPAKAFQRASIKIGKRDTRIVRCFGKQWKTLLKKLSEALPSGNNEKITKIGKKDWGRACI